MARHTEREMPVATHLTKAQKTLLARLVEITRESPANRCEAFLSVPLPSGQLMLHHTRANLVATVEPSTMLALQLAGFIELNKTPRNLQTFTVTRRGTDYAVASGLREIH